MCTPGIKVARTNEEVCVISHCLCSPALEPTSYLGVTSECNISEEKDPVFARRHLLLFNCAGIFQGVSEDLQHDGATFLTQLTIKFTLLTISQQHVSAAVWSPRRVARQHTEQRQSQMGPTAASPTSATGLFV